jgi:phage terminase large subunit GpA-like protein
MTISGEFSANAPTTRCSGRGGNTRADGCCASMPRRSIAAALARGRRAARNRSIIFARRGFRAGYAVKGQGGPQRVWRPAAKKGGGVRLFIVGVHHIKTEIMERLAAEPFIDIAAVPCQDDQGCGRNPQAIRVSASLPDAWFEQVTAERRFIRYVRNRAVIEFRPIRSGIRNEGLDCLVYAMAARREDRLR